MKLFILVLISSLLFLSACSKQETLQGNHEDCTLIANAKILAREELPCSYNEVYLLDGQFYTTCVCCVCDKASMALDCEGQPLCDIWEDCMTDFYEKAVYLYAIEEL